MAYDEPKELSGSTSSLKETLKKRSNTGTRSGKDQRALGRRRNSGNENSLSVQTPSNLLSPTSEYDDDIPLSSLTRRASLLHARSQSPPRQERAITSPTANSPKQVGTRRASGTGHSLSQGQNTNVRVMVRVRPFSNSEVEEVRQSGGYMQSVIEMPRRDQVLLLDHNNEYSVVKGFNFDEVFWSCTQQESKVAFSDQKRVYEMTGLPALQGAWDGINSCIFAYGQTGSGKTHTMMGDPEQIQRPEGCDENLLGVIPRLCRDLFDELEEKEKNAAQAGLRRKSDVRVRFYEIYNEKVKDLLCSVEGEKERFKYDGTTQKKLDPDDLKIREHPTEGPYVEGISIHNPRTYEDIIRLINAGNQERSVGSTNLNDRSSRSHALFRITVTQTTFYDQQRVGIGGPKTTTSQRRANINLVDLAGSENVKRSGARGSVLLEAQKINLSLTTLRRVIDALIEKKAKVNVPYRDSTLTWLLREDLGGNAKTFMLATVSPHYLNAHESLRTLEYAMRARSIVNNVRVNEDETAKMLADLEKKMLDARKQMNDARTDAEVQELEQKMEEAKKASKEIQDRLEEASAEVTAYKEKLEAEKEKNMAFAFRHAVMLRAAKLRLSNAESKSQVHSEELQAIKNKMAETGHDNIGDLAVSLVRERGKVTDLERENMEIQRQKQELERKHEELLKQLRNEEEAAKTGREQADLLDKESKKKEEEYKQELYHVQNTLTRQYEELVERHQQQLKMLEANHDKELRGIIDENQSMVEEFQTQVQEFELKLVNEREEHSKAMRLLEQDREQQQRYLHADIARSEEMINNLDFELREATRLKEKYYEELNSARQVFEREKAEALYTQERRHEEFVSDLTRKHEQRVEDLKDIVKLAHTEAENSHKEKVQIQKFFSDVQHREEKYQGTFDLVCHFLAQINDGDIPPNWDLEDVRRLVRTFAQYKKEYASYRPNKELLKTMLRINPTRRAADRIKELLAEDATDSNDQLQMLMGGMKCPELSEKEKVSRLEGSPQRADDSVVNDSAAAGYQYPLESASVVAAHTSLAGTLSKRRSRTSPRMSAGTDYSIEAPQTKKKGPRMSTKAKTRDFKHSFAKTVK